MKKQMFCPLKRHHISYIFSLSIRNARNPDGYEKFYRHLKTRRIETEMSS